MKYYYLVERIRDGKRFVAIGNHKLSWLGVSDLYDFVSSGYSQESPYGLIRNISTDISYNKREYKVIHQTLKEGI
jgi:hypothetical protein